MYDDDIYSCVRTYIPKEMDEWLKRMSKATNTPVSRLIAIALDNERDQGANAFNYPCDIPEGEYQEYMYAKEAGLLMDFIGKCTGGIAIDSIMLARRDIGIPDRDKVLYALRELFEKDILETFVPNRTKFHYGEDYFRVRIKGQNKPTRRFKRIEGKSTKGKRWVKDKDIER